MHHFTDGHPSIQDHTKVSKFVVHLYDFGILPDRRVQQLGDGQGQVKYVPCTGCKVFQKNNQVLVVDADCHIPSDDLVVRRLFSGRLAISEHYSPAMRHFLIARAGQQHDGHLEEEYHRYCLEPSAWAYFSPGVSKVVQDRVCVPAPSGSMSSAPAGMMARFEPSQSMSSRVFFS